jgi:hypothetical protein
MVESSKAQESLESSHGLSSTVVERRTRRGRPGVDPADAVVGANQPLLQVTDGTVSQGYNRSSTLAQFRPQGLNAGNVLETEPFQARESLQAIRIKDRCCRHILDEEVVDGVGREIRDVRAGVKEQQSCRFAGQQCYGRGRGKKLYRSFYMR